MLCSNFILPIKYKCFQSFLIYCASELQIINHRKLKFMKKPLLIILATILLFSTYQTHAQAVDFVFTITNASSDTSCDGQLNIQCTNPIAPMAYNWYNDSGYVTSTGPNVSGLCPGHYWVGMYSNCQYYSLDANVSTSSISGPSFQMNVTVNHSNGSTPASLEVHQVSGGTTPYYMWFWNNFNTNEVDTLNTISNLIFDSLSINDSLNYPYVDYYFYVTDSNYNNNNFFNGLNFYFNAFSDTINSCTSYTNYLWASVQGVPVTDSSLCDGYAYTEIYGGTPPYTYQFSSGSTNSTATGLCPGSYIVTVTDADSNTFSTTFVIGYPGTYYFSDGGNYNYLDTLYSNALQDCGIDYTLPIDTFYIDSSYSSNWQYIIDWVIVQDTNEFLFTETYFIDTTGYYWFGLSLYCDERSSDFGSYTFFAGAHADMSGATQVQELAKDNPISVYPNPSNGIYQLKSSSKMKEYTIYDQLGRMVAHKRLNSDNETVNISELHNGVYYFVVQFQDGSIGKQKLVKK